MIQQGTGSTKSPLRLTSGHVAVQVPAARSGGSSRSASRSATAGGAERRHRRAAAAASDAETAAQAAEADGALERFTEFLTRHESELQPRTRQVQCSHHISHVVKVGILCKSITNRNTNQIRLVPSSHLW